MEEKEYEELEVGNRTQSTEQESRIRRALALNITNSDWIFIRCPLWPTRYDSFSDVGANPKLSLTGL